MDLSFTLGLVSEALLPFVVMFQCDILEQCDQHVLSTGMMRTEPLYSLVTMTATTMVQGRIQTCLDELSPFCWLYPSEGKDLRASAVRGNGAKSSIFLPNT